MVDKQMTIERLDEIEARVKTATQGPWRVYMDYAPTDMIDLIAEVRRLRANRAAVEVAAYAAADAREVARVYRELTGTTISDA